MSWAASLSSCVMLQVISGKQVWANRLWSSPRVHPCSATWGNHSSTASSPTPTRPTATPKDSKNSALQSSRNVPISMVSSNSGSLVPVATVVEWAALRSACRAPGSESASCSSWTPSDMPETSTTESVSAKVSRRGRPCAPWTCTSQRLRRRDSDGRADPRTETPSLISLLLMIPLLTGLPNHVSSTVSAAPMVTPSPPAASFKGKAQVPMNPSAFQVCLWYIVSATLCFGWKNRITYRWQQS
mmetsp:Transcript_53497/g.142134  ORF Transcript_53497/g.142134 Transcript_53497/m.142134 type:complete len:243 (+) Transcript_53497:233-961(+)